MGSVGFGWSKRDLTQAGLEEIGAWRSQRVVGDGQAEHGACHVRRSRQTGRLSGGHLSSFDRSPTALASPFARLVPTRPRRGSWLWQYVALQQCDALSPFGSRHTARSGCGRQHHSPSSRFTHAPQCVGRRGSDGNRFIWPDRCGKLFDIVLADHDTGFGPHLFGPTESRACL